MDDSDRKKNDWSDSWYWPRTQVYSSNVSTIYRASSNGRSVAIKRAVYRGALYQDIGKYIEYEERALRGCDQHPHIVRLLDANGVGLNRELMFEWITGKTLEQSPQFPIETATQLFREIVTATRAIHQGGFLHSDLHPKNIMVRDGHVVIIDLGLAYPLREKPYFQKFGGSEGYRAPERCENEQAGIFSDIYSLGAVLYYLAHGSHAFHKSDAHRVSHREMPPKIPDVPPLDK